MRRAAPAVLAALALLLTACTPQTPPQPVDPSVPTPTPREYLTVGTTDTITQLDPAGITTAASAGMAANVFQRLWTVPIGSADERSVPKPEAAKDCVFETATEFVCVLNEGMTFHNGHPLTSSDVKFSIERALRIDTPGSSVSLLKTLRRIETPDDLTVRFELNRPDTQFALALASPAASIVDEEVYDADALRPADLTVVGSGPYRISQQTDPTVRFDRFAKYIGPTHGREQTIVVQTFPDSGALETAMTQGGVDAVWRGLSAAAVTRLDTQITASPEQRSDAGFTGQTLPGARVHRLLWATDSPQRGDAELRTAISSALQGDRTLDSLVPPTVAGSVPSFPVGGQPSPSTQPRRATLVLSYDSTMPDGGDLAELVRSRVEGIGDVSVRIVPDTADADLFLLDEKAWTPTPLAWLQSYTDAPAVGSTLRVQELTDRWRASTDPLEVEGLLSELQKQAAADAVVVPLRQGDEPLYLARGTTWDPAAFGPGWQLGLWGLARA